MSCPVVSEKSYASMAEGRYVFRCHPDGDKIEIEKAVEEAFVDQKITVSSVNTINVRGKKRRRSRASRGSWDKAPTGRRRS